MKINLDRTVLNITTFCNLRCKHCLAYIPYYTEKHHVPLQEAKNILKAYFQVVDTVNHFTVTGGEPLLNPDCYEIIKWIASQYSEQICESMDFVTNGTLKIPEKMLNLFEENNEKVKVVVSDYGPTLSTKMAEICEDLERRRIQYRISKFHGDNLYYDGWIDFTDHSEKWMSLKEREQNAQKCIHRNGHYFIINEGALWCCSRGFWRAKNGIIPKLDGEWVPLTDPNISLEEKRRRCINMYSLKSSTSCGYCVGLCNDVPRVAPAQQLPAPANHHTD